MEYLFNLKGAVSKIKDFDFKRVILQFPDDLIEYSVDVYHYMVEELNSASNNSSVDLYISADSTYGSSSDDVSAMHVDGDLLIYFGSDLSSTSVIPVLLLPRIRSLDSTLCENAVVPCIEKYINSFNCKYISPSIVILYDPSFAGDSLDKLNAALILRYGAESCSLARLPATADMGSWQPTSGMRTCSSSSSSSSSSSGCCQQGAPETESKKTYCECSNGSTAASNDSNSSVSSGNEINSSVPDNSNLSNSVVDANDFIIGGLIIDRISIKISTEITEDEMGSIIVYIGNKVEQLNSIMLRLSGNTIIHYAPLITDRLHGENPEDRSDGNKNPTATVNTIVGSQSRLFRERYGGIAKVKDATVVGLIIGSMGMSSIVTNSVVTRLRILIESSKRQCIVLTMGRINESKLSNFPEIDIFCLITNDDVAYIPPKTFHIPVITPWELELGLGARDWDSSYRVDVSSIVGNGLSDLKTAIENVIKNSPEDPIDEDSDEEDLRGNKNSSSISSDAVSSSSGTGGSSNTAASVQTVTVKSSSALALSASAIPSIERYLQREYKGLDPRVQHNSNLGIQTGMYGTSLGYSYGRKEVGASTDELNERDNSEETSADEVDHSKYSGGGK